MPDENHTVLLFAVTILPTYTSLPTNISTCLIPGFSTYDLFLLLNLDIQS